MHNLTNNQRIQVKERDDSVYFPIRFTHIIRIDNVWCWHGCNAIGTFTYEVSREATGWYLFMSFCLLIGMSMVTILKKRKHSSKILV